jgi:ketosteroid isomerase-like protein
MSRENVEVVRQVIEAWRRGDFEAALSFYAENAVYESKIAGGSGRLTGRAGVARGFEEWLGTFTDYWVEIDGLLENGDQVIQLHREGGRGKGSGALTERQGAVIYTFSKGDIVRVQIFADQAAALEAAGLRE